MIARLGFHIFSWNVNWQKWFPFFFLERGAGQASFAIATCCNTYGRLSIQRVAGQWNNIGINWGTFSVCRLRQHWRILCGVLWCKTKLNGVDTALNRPLRNEHGGVAWSWLLLLKPRIGYLYSLHQSQRFCFYCVCFDNVPFFLPFYRIRFSCSKVGLYWETDAVFAT